MLGTEVNKDMEHIRKDIASLREDVSALTASLKHLATARGREAVDRIEDIGGRAKIKASELKDTAEREIGEHPFTSILTSFGVGFAMGMILDRKR